MISRLPFNIMIKFIIIRELGRPSSGLSKASLRWASPRIGLHMCLVRLVGNDISAKYQCLMYPGLGVSYMSDLQHKCTIPQQVHREQH